MAITMADRSKRLPVGSKSCGESLHAQGKVQAAAGRAELGERIRAKSGRLVKQQASSGAPLCRPLSSAVI